MSANNFILINRKSFDVSLRDADTGKSLAKIGKSKNIDTAIDIATKYQKTEIVEYGIHYTKDNK